MILRRGITGTGLGTGLAPDPTLAGTNSTGLAEQIPTLRTKVTSSTTFTVNFILDGLWIGLFVIREKDSSGEIAPS